MKFNIVLTSLLIILGFTGCTVIAIAINPDIFTSFFSNSPRKLFYDLEHYSNLAVQPACNAFYPLWPWLINKLGRVETVNDAAFYFRIFGSFLSLISIPLFLWLLSQNIKDYKIATLAVALYAMNPLSIFRVIGYTEGLFSVLSLILLITLSQIKITSKIQNLASEFKKESSVKTHFLGGTEAESTSSIQLISITVILFLLSLLLSLTRPFLIQAIFASSLALGSILFINKLQNNPNLVQTLKIYTIPTLSIWLGAVAGYALYGYTCLELRGDFLAPFHDQKNWGKELGFYPQLFFIPITYADFVSIYAPVLGLIAAWLICISTTLKRLTFVVPKFWQWLLLFAYPPAFLGFYGSDFKTANSSKFSEQQPNLKAINLTRSAKNLPTSYVFWFCIYFALIHSVIVVFSDPNLASLRRYIFGTPHFFLAIAYISQCFPDRKLGKLLKWLLGLSSVGLVQYWLDYDQYVWIG